MNLQPARSGGIRKKELLLDDAREDREIRRELGNAVRESSARFNNAFDKHQCVNKSAGKQHLQVH